MKSPIDDTLSRLAHSTHSPRGKHAASDPLYQELLHRMPAEQRPHPMPNIPRKSGIAHWWSAACLLVVAGIGVAIAGVLYQQHRHSVAAAGSQGSQSQEESYSEFRTLSYHNAPLSAIVAELSEAYQVPIEIQDDKLLDYRLTATFTTHEPLADVLSILAEAGGFEVQETTDGFVIK